MRPSSDDDQTTTIIDHIEEIDMTEMQTAVAADSSFSGYEIREGFSIIRLANPPVNGLSDVTRRKLRDALAAAGADDVVGGVIITGEGKGFCGGADLRQMGTPAASAEPTIPQLFEQIQALGKPTVAAIHGFALGGGLELALVCNYRVASPGAKIGLTETTVGLLPGAGGTQRLPRLIGASRSLDLIRRGRKIDTAEALNLGILDKSITGDIVTGAVEFVQAQLDGGAIPPRIDDIDDIDTSGVDFDQARAAVRHNDGNRVAQLTAIDAIELATAVPLADGLAFERARFRELVDGDDAKALRHVFFARTKAGRVDSISDDVGPRAIKNVAVIGAGTMGSGIAMAFANAGFPVELIETDAAALDRGVDTIRQNYSATVDKGRISHAEAEDRMGRISAGVDFAAVETVDMVIEAVFEDMDVKKELFGRLEARSRPGTILASNTSRLNIDEIAESISRPQDVIGTHFFSPANVMKLLEVVKGDLVADDVVKTALEVGRSLGKTPVVSGVCDGFIGNRMLTPYRREADFLLEEGASPQQVDSALRAFGFAMGPLAMSDLAGLDIGWAARKRLEPTRPKHLRYSRIADSLCEEGRFGQKTGAGFFRYESGSRQPHPDPHVDEIIRACAEDSGVRRREVTDEEIVDRCVLALVNEGAWLLGEGIAQRASDIDVVYVDGYGFPAYHGGPMYWAERQGLAQVLDRIRVLEAAHGEFWTPAPLLVEAVGSGRVSF